MRIIFAYAFIVVILFALSGCAGLNVSWQASYNMPQAACIANTAIQCPVITANNPVLLKSSGVTFSPAPFVAPSDSSTLYNTLP